MARVSDGAIAEYLKSFAEGDPNYMGGGDIKAVVLDLRDARAELERVKGERDGVKDGRDILSGDCLRLGDDNARLRGVLEKIANIDYRGNRSTESDVARAALNGDGGEDG